MARGEFVALLDHDDEFARDALYAVALELNRARDAVLIYSDEDKIDQYGWRFDPYFKSDWNPDLLTAQNCISHLGVFRTANLRKIGGFAEGVEGCQDWDIALKITEGIPASQIRHIPRVLYHWRAIPGSTALALGEKSYIDVTGRKMLEDHFERLGEEVEIEPVEGGHWRIKYALKESPLVTIIIPTRNQAGLLRRCIESVIESTSYRKYEFLIVDNQSDDSAAVNYLSTLATSGIPIVQYTEPFNYSAINNAAVNMARGDLICFLNNDMEVITPEWLEEMVFHACRPEIGAVGAKLLFPDDTLQHTGIVLGLGGPAGHILYKFNSNTGGYYNRARLVCDYSAVTAACMVIRRSTFEEVGGFDEKNLAVSYNDVDLCLRIQAAGYRNLYTPFAQLYHHESASRGEDATEQNRARSQSEIEYMWKQWGDLLLHDPAYNPNLSLERENYSLASPPRISGLWENGIQAQRRERS
jgi:GT2 family glycosyltransferase